MRDTKMGARSVQAHDAVKGGARGVDAATSWTPQQPQLFETPKPLTALEREGLRRDAPALNGTKPGRTNRDPRFIKRRRKALWP